MKDFEKELEELAEILMQSESIPASVEILKELVIIKKDMKPYTNEMMAFILTNILRFLTEGQKSYLCFDIYSRSSLKENIDKKITQLKRLNSLANMAKAEQPITGGNDVSQ